MFEIVMRRVLVCGLLGLAACIGESASPNAGAQTEVLATVGGEGGGSDGPTIIWVKAIEENDPKVRGNVVDVYSDSTCNTKATTVQDSCASGFYNLYEWYTDNPSDPNCHPIFVRFVDCSTVISGGYCNAGACVPRGGVGGGTGSKITN